MVLPRRGFLGALALAPAALAGCASGSAAARGGPAAAARARDDDRADAALAAVRSHPLPAEAEPALVFRAAAARPGEP